MSILHLYKARNRPKLLILVQIQTVWFLSGLLHSWRRWAELGILNRFSYLAFSRRHVDIYPSIYLSIDRFIETSSIFLTSLSSKIFFLWWVKVRGCVCLYYINYSIFINICLFVPYQINVKTVEPIRPNFLSHDLRPGLWPVEILKFLNKF